MKFDKDYTQISTKNGLFLFFSIEMRHTKRILTSKERDKKNNKNNN